MTDQTEARTPKPFIVSNTATRCYLTDVDTWSPRLKDAKRYASRKEAIHTANNINEAWGTAQRIAVCARAGAPH